MSLFVIILSNNTDCVEKQSLFPWKKVVQSEVFEVTTFGSLNLKMSTVDSKDNINAFKCSKTNM